MKLSWWSRLFRRRTPQTLLAPPPEVSEAAVVKVDAEQSLTVVPEPEVSAQDDASRQIEPAVEIKRVIELGPVTSADTASRPTVSPTDPPIDPPIDPVSEIEADIAPIPETEFVEPPKLSPVESESRTTVPATIPKTALQAPARSEEWLRTRALYFTPANYSSPSGSERILAPDLLFRLGIEKQRVLVEAAPENAIADHLAPTPFKSAPRPMEDFATAAGPQAAPANSGGRVLSVEPLLLTLFFCEREAGPGVPAEATAEYLTEPALLLQGLNLRDRVLQNWAARGAPLSPRQFYDLALGITPHAGTALLLCQNTAKAFARGGEAIRWQIVNRNRGEYYDGKSNHTATVLHRDGVLRSGPLAHPSLFYLLFSARAFGTADSGDWYRFFSAATAVDYAAGRQSRMPAAPPSPEAEERARWIDEIARLMRDRDAEWTPGYRGWLWINALTFFESGNYAPSQAAVNRENVVARRGAAFGLKEAAPDVSCNWEWFVPLKGVMFAKPFDLGTSTAESIAPEKDLQE